jgi:uncharacterized coiled-coil DUF342 family protein
MSKEEEKAAKSARVVATPAKKAIMKERKRRAAMPMKERPKEIRPSTVKGIIQAILGEMEAIQNKRMDIQKGVADIHIGIRTMGSSINEQKKKNKEAIAAFYGSVGELYESIIDQAKENREAASAIFSGARDIQMGIRALQSSINETIKENADYVKNFYG